MLSLQYLKIFACFCWSLKVSALPSFSERIWKLLIYQSLEVLIYLCYQLMCFMFVLYLIRAKRNRDIDQSPRSKPEFFQVFYISQWNRNSIYGHNFVKLPLLRACVAIHNFDVVFLLETYFKAAILSPFWLAIYCKYICYVSINWP